MGKYRLLSLRLLVSPKQVFTLNITTLWHYIPAWNHLMKYLKWKWYYSANFYWQDILFQVISYLSGLEILGLEAKCFDLPFSHGFGRWEGVFPQLSSFIWGKEALRVCILPLSLDPSYFQLLVTAGKLHFSSPCLAGIIILVLKGDRAHKTKQKERPALWCLQFQQCDQQGAALSSDPIHFVNFRELSVCSQNTPVCAHSPGSVNGKQT